MTERKAAAVRTHVCGILLLAILLVFALSSCGGLYEYKNEVAAMKEFYDYFDDPSQLEISTFDKYAVSKREIYYYTEWSYPFENGSGPFEVLLVYNVKSRQLQLRFFNDMERKRRDRADVSREHGAGKEQTEKREEQGRHGAQKGGSVPRFPHQPPKREREVEYLCQSDHQDIADDPEARKKTEDQKDGQGGIRDVDPHDRYLLPDPF